jgi:predicted metal-binding protein
VAQARILICSSCSGTRDRDAERQAVSEALSRAGLEDSIELAEHACFNGCQDPVALALQGGGMASYVFSGVDVVADADDVAATCRTYLDSPAGWIEDARPCGRLRLCLRTRIPALQST